MLHQQSSLADTLNGSRDAQTPSEESLSHPSSPAEEMPRRSFFKRFALAGMAGGIALLLAACSDGTGGNGTVPGDSTPGTNNSNSSDDDDNNNNNNNSSGDDDDDDDDDSGGDDDDDDDDIIKVIHW